jgi:hypothetical protein
MSAPKSGGPILPGPLGWENLIVNGNAEAGATAQGWTILIGSIDVVGYNASGFPTTNSPGPPDRGLNFFAGGSGNPVSRAVAGA